MRGAKFRSHLRHYYTKANASRADARPNGTHRDEPRHPRADHACGFRGVPLLASDGPYCVPLTVTVTDGRAA